MLLTLGIGPLSIKEMTSNGKVFELHGTSLDAKLHSLWLLVSITTLERTVACMLVCCVIALERGF